MSIHIKDSIFIRHHGVRASGHWSGDGSMVGFDAYGRCKHLLPDGFDSSRNCREWFSSHSVDQVTGRGTISSQTLEWHLNRFLLHRNACGWADHNRPLTEAGKSLIVLRVFNVKGLLSSSAYCNVKQNLN